MEPAITWNEQEIRANYPICTKHIYTSHNNFTLITEINLHDVMNINYSGLNSNLQYLNTSYVIRFIIYA